MTIFSRKKRAPTADSTEKSSKVPAHGSLELYLANEGYLAPADTGPQRPATSTTSNTDSFQKPLDDGRQYDKSFPKPMRTDSRRKRNLFSLRYTECDEKENKKVEIPEWPLLNNVIVDQVPQAPPSNYLKRFISTANKRAPSPSKKTSSYTDHADPPPQYSYSVHDDESLTALPSFPSREKDATPKQLNPTPRVEETPRGEAARTAAAAQNELNESMRSLRVTEQRVARDSESGVGIEVRDQSEDNSEFDKVIPRIDPIRALPAELMGHVLSFLDAASLVNAELASHSWHASATSPHVWREIYRAEYQNHLHGMSHSQRSCSKPGVNRDWKSMCRAHKELRQRWRNKHAAAIYLEGHTDSVYCVQFDKDKILTGSRDRTIRIWDARTYACYKVLGMPSRGHGSPAPPLPADLDRTNQGPRPFTRLHVPLTAIKPDPVLPYLYHTGSILCLQYDDSLMMTGSSDCTLIMWDVSASYRPYRRLRGHSAGVLDVCFDDKHIVSCSKDATVGLWERRTGELLHKFTGHRGPVNAVQLRGDLVVSASGDGIAKLWNLTSGLCIKEFPSRDRGMACVDFSPDSRTILAGGNDQVIYQFDASTGELVREMKGHEDLVRSLHLDSASGRIVSGSYDMSVRAYDLRSGEPVVEFKKWTSSWILSAKADYRRIVATSQDSRAVIMDFGYQLEGVEMLEV